MRMIKYSVQLTKNMGAISSLLGIVKDGKFLPLESCQGFLGPVRLTSIRMREARSPESGDLNLEDYEGSVIMVWSQGSGGGWLYDAKITDQAGPILTALALRIFGQDNQTAGGGYPAYFPASWASRATMEANSESMRSGQERLFPGRSNGHLSTQNGDPRS
jgi:hypothetical protein